MTKVKTIVAVQVEVDKKNRCYKNTKYSDGSISSEPISVEEAALIQAQQGGF